jgi:integrase
LACLWLATYPNVRPNELINVKEKDFDLLNGTLEINLNKENKPKKIYLLAEDVEIVKSFPRSFPELYFFRKENGEKFGRELLYQNWRRACKNLGIECVSLYPGTKHSTATDIKHSLGSERAREATGHSTNKAFERYIVGDPKDLRALYTYARPDKGLTKDFCTSEGLNLLKFKEKSNAEGGTRTPTGLPTTPSR